MCERAALERKLCERGVLQWKMCERAALECLYILDFVPDPYKTQGMCKKVILEVLELQNIVCIGASTTLFFSKPLLNLKTFQSLSF